MQLTLFIWINININESTKSLLISRCPLFSRPLRHLNSSNRPQFANFLHYPSHSHSPSFSPFCKRTILHISKFCNIFLSPNHNVCLSLTLPIAFYITITQSLTFFNSFELHFTFSLTLSNSPTIILIFSFILLFSLSLYLSLTLSSHRHLAVMYRLFYPSQTGARK